MIVSGQSACSSAKAPNSSKSALVEGSSVRLTVCWTHNPPEELKAMVDEAAGARRVVAAHCHAKEGTMDALMRA